MSNTPILPYPWQEAAWSKLIYQNAKERLAHAYLFYGPTGIGKFDFVFNFSRYLLCNKPENNNACGKCTDCKLHDSIHPNLKVLMPECNSTEIKVDQVRILTEFLSKTGHSGRLKICIINDADRLYMNSTNALLKTLEETSGESILFL